MRALVSNGLIVGAILSYYVTTFVHNSGQRSYTLDVQLLSASYLFNARAINTMTRLKGALARQIQIHTEIVQTPLRHCLLDLSS